MVNGLVLSAFLLHLSTQSTLHNLIQACSFYYATIHTHSYSDGYLPQGYLLCRLEQPGIELIDFIMSNLD